MQICILLCSWFRLASYGALDSGMCSIRSLM
jgi:hypothetical protein